MTTHTRALVVQNAKLCDLAFRFNVPTAEPMDKRVFEEIADYFEAVSAQLEGDARQAKLFDNASVVGGIREEVYQRFLERHLPKSCDVFRGGYVFNVEGMTSHQTDVIVTSGLAPRFKMGSSELAIAPIEGAVCLAETKSNLDKAELVKSLDALRELPPINQNAVAVNPGLKTPRHYAWDVPYKVIFAYKGSEAQTIHQHIVTYYENNPDVPQERRPSLVHVLGQYAIFRIADDLTVTDADGTMARHQRAVGGYYPFSRDCDLIAMTMMLTTILENLFLANHTLVRYRKYSPNITDVVLRRPFPR